MRLLTPALLKSIYMLTLLLRTKQLKLFWLKIFSICHRFQQHQWCTLSCENLLEFSTFLDIIETALMGYSGAWGKRKNNQKLKTLWHCPFKMDSFTTYISHTHNSPSVNYRLYHILWNMCSTLMPVQSHTSLSGNVVNVTISAWIPEAAKPF
jgi:hypothetical protein